MKRASGLPGTGRARPPRCLVRWKCDSPRSFITSRRSSCRGLGRDLAVSLAVPEPFLSRFSIRMDKKSGFEAQKRLKDHHQRRTRWPQHDLCLSIARRWAGVMLGPTGAPLAVIFEAFLGLKTPKTRPFGSRNGSETAHERPEKRPSFGQAHGKRFS